MSKYKEIRKISAEGLRGLCISKNWYTRGTCKEYEHLLYGLAEEKQNITTDDIVEIAEDIMEHSSTEHTLEGICFEVARIAITFFEEV